MKKISLLILPVVCLLATLFFAPAVSAQGNSNTAGSGGVQGGLNNIGSAFPVGSPDESFANVVRVVITWALYIAAVIAVLVIIYGGFLYITSGGDATQAKKGRTALVNAIIGLVIAVLAYVVIQVVYNTLLHL